MSEVVVFRDGGFVSPSDISRPSPVSRNVGGAVFETPNSGGSISFNDGRSISHQPTTSNSYRVNSNAPAQDPGTITQARTSWGSPVTGADIKETSIVRIGSMETTVKAAIAAGLVSKNQDGSFAVMDRSQGKAGGQQQQKQPQDQQQEQDPQQQEQPKAAEVLTGELEHAMSVFNERVSPTTIMGAVLDLAKGQGIRDEHISRAADQLRTSPDRVREMAERLRTAFEGQAKTTLNTTGLNPDDVFAWAWENKPDMMKEAIRRHATERTTEGYMKIADNYLSQLDTIAPQYLQGAELGEGLSLRKGANGKFIIRTPKGEFEYRSALRMGLIKVSRARG